MKGRARLWRIAASLLVLTGCGTTVLYRTIEPAAAPSVEPTSIRQQQLSKGTQKAVNLANGAPAIAAADRCAKNADPAHGFTSKSIEWGTIIPLTGALRPLGEQTARVMRVSVDYLNSVTSVPGGFDWGCPGRPGIWGRTVNLTVLSLSDHATPMRGAKLFLSVLTSVRSESEPSFAKTICPVCKSRFAIWFFAS